MEHPEEHPEDDRDSDRDDDGEPCLRALEVFKLSAPFDAIACWQLDICFNRGLGILNPRDEISTADIHLDADRAATILPAHHRRSIALGEFNDLFERDAQACGRRDEELTNRLGRGLGRRLDDANIKAPLLLVDLTRLDALSRRTQ